MSMKKRFSDQLRRAVESGEKTRYQISKETGIDQGNLSRFVNDGAGLSLASIDELCKCLKLRLVPEGKHSKRKGR